MLSAVSGTDSSNSTLISYCSLRRADFPALTKGNVGWDEVKKDYEVQFPCAVCDRGVRILFCAGHVVDGNIKCIQG